MQVACPGPGAGCASCCAHQPSRTPQQVRPACHAILASLWSVLFVLPSPCVSPQKQTNLDYLLASSANPCGLQQAWPWWCNKPAAHSCACRKAPAFDVVLQTPSAQQQRTPSYGRPRSRPATRARRPCGSYCLAALNIAAAQTPSRQQQARRGPCTRPSP